MRCSSEGTSCLWIAVLAAGHTDMHIGVHACILPSACRLGANVQCQSDQEQVDSWAYVSANLSTGH